MYLTLIKVLRKFFRMSWVSFSHLTLVLVPLPISHEQPTGHNLHNPHQGWTGRNIPASREESSLHHQLSGPATQAGPDLVPLHLVPHHPYGLQAGADGGNHLKKIINFMNKIIHNELQSYVSYLDVGVQEALQYSLSLIALCCCSFLTVVWISILPRNLTLPTVLCYSYSS